MLFYLVPLQYPNASVRFIHDMAIFSPCLNLQLLIDLDRGEAESSRALLVKLSLAELCLGLSATIVASNNKIRSLKNEPSVTGSFQRGAQQSMFENVANETRSTSTTGNEPLGFQSNDLDKSSRSGPSKKSSFRPEPSDPRRSSSFPASDRSSTFVLLESH